MRDPADLVYPQSLAFMRVLGVLQGRLHTRSVPFNQSTCPAFAVVSVITDTS